MNVNTLKFRANQALTGLGLRNKGFYSPYDYLDSVDWDEAHYPAIRHLFDRRVQSFRAFLDQMDDLEASLVGLAADPDGPQLNSRFLSPLDAASVYTAMVRYRPARVLEIGSGNTTHFMARAIADHDLPTRITCVDPEPRLDITGLDVDFQRRVLNRGDVDLIASLEPGDVLFIDSSHFMQQGFDVDILFNSGFPALKPGVIVHVHDVFLPYGYPSHWEWLRFNEQMALVGWLVSEFFEPLFAAHYVLRDMADDLADVCRSLGLHHGCGGSLWMQKA